MDTNALRQKILDLAIRGKLVPQDPNDEPASVLLERIRAEKKQMVKDGKLKAKDIKNDTIIFKGEDNLHYEKFQDGTVKCIEDEIPFDVPEGWEWCRLGGVSVDVLYGLSNSAEASGTHRLLRITDIQDGKVDWSSVPFTTVKDKDDYLLKDNDIVFARTGATVGKSFLIKDAPDNSVYASYLIRIRTISHLNPEYIYHFFNSGCYWVQITDKSVGVGQPNCNGSSLRELIIPIPPLLQQPLIASKANQLLSIANSIEDRKEFLSSIIVQSKSKILDLAIRGKLVPQDPNDEPASVLLERIRLEKEELIKQGKIKRDKNDSVIFKGDDNSYYLDFPSTWVITKLSNISEVITKGTTPRGGKVAYSDEGVGFLRAENIAGYDRLELCNLNYVDEESHNNYLKRSILKTNDILITIAGTLGRTAIVPTSALPLNTNQAVSIVRLLNYQLVDIRYVIYAINSPTVKNHLLMQSVDMAIPNLSLDNISNCTIPLPPISEQKRIIETVKALFTQLDKIITIIS